MTALKQSLLIIAGVAMFGAVGLLLSQAVTLVGWTW